MISFIMDYAVPLVVIGVLSVLVTGFGVWLLRAILQK